jgi:hypothetical protein
VHVVEHEHCRFGIQHSQHCVDDDQEVGVRLGEKVHRLQPAIALRIVERRNDFAPERDGVTVAFFTRNPHGIRASFANPRRTTLLPAPGGATTAVSGDFAPVSSRSSNRGRATWNGGSDGTDDALVRVSGPPRESCRRKHCNRIDAASSERSTR